MDKWIKKTASIILAVSLIIVPYLTAAGAGASLVTVSSVTGDTGKTVTVAVSLSNAGGIAGYQMDITYDPSVAVATGVENGITSPVSNLNNSDTGKILVAWASSQALQSSGTLFSVQFKLKGNSGSSCSLSLSNASFNNVNASPVSVNIVNGKIGISSSSATLPGDTGTGSQTGGSQGAGAGAGSGGDTGNGAGTEILGGGSGIFPAENPLTGAASGTGGQEISPPPVSDNGGNQTSATDVNPGSGISIDITQTASQKDSTGTNGVKATELDLNENKIREILSTQSDVGSLIINMPNESDQNTATFNASVVDSLVKNDVSLTIKTNDAVITMPPDLFDSNMLKKSLGTTADKIEISVRVNERPFEATGLKNRQIISSNQTLTMIGNMVSFEIEAKAAGKIVHIDNFGEKTVKGVISYGSNDIANVANIYQLGVFKYDSKNKRWEARPGYVDAEKKQVVFFTHTFSDYSILENIKTFNDIAKHWAKNDIELLASKGIVSGVSAKAFAPEAKLTRAAFLSMVVNAVCLDYMDSGYFHGKLITYNDVKASAWYYKNFKLACEAGIVMDNGKKSFYPNNYITREEAALMIMRAYDFMATIQPLSGNPSGNADFKDTARLGSESRKAISRAVGLNIISVGKDNMYRPADNTTRAQGAAFICRLLKATGRL